MRNLSFQVISDVHFEKNTISFDKLIKPVAKNLIIAGDLGHVENYGTYVHFLKYFCSKFQNVILVPGNHEYYSKSERWTMDHINQKLKSIPEDYKLSNLHVLIDQSIVLDDILIHGSTFWSFCHQMKPMYIYMKENKLIGINDYNLLHYQAIQSLTESIEKAVANKTHLLVITHHAPSFRGVLDPRHEALGPESGRNTLYFSNSDVFVNHPSVIGWIYGHTGFNGSLERNAKLITNQADIHTYVPNFKMNLKYLPKSKL